MSMYSDGLKFKVFCSPDTSDLEFLVNGFLEKNKIKIIKEKFSITNQSQKEDKNMVKIGNFYIVTLYYCVCGEDENIFTK